MNWEYRVVPAPEKARRFRGVRGPEARFARTIEEVINQMAASGWEYCRAELLPETVRRRSSTYRNLLIFRRDPANAPEIDQTPLLEAPEPTPGHAVAKAGFGKRLRGGFSRLSDGVMARSTSDGTPKDGKREEPLFQHEALHKDPKAPEHAPEKPEVAPEQDKT